MLCSVSISTLGNWRHGEQLVGCQVGHEKFPTTSQNIPASEGTTPIAFLIDPSETIGLVASQVALGSSRINVLELSQGEKWNFNPKSIIVLSPEVEERETRALPIFCLEECGDLILAGTNQGEICIIDSKEIYDRQTNSKQLRVDRLLSSGTSSVQKKNAAPSELMPSTLVRQIRVHADSGVIAGSIGCDIVAWNGEGDVDWKITKSREESPVSCMQWCPCSAPLLLTGSVGGFRRLFDTRSSVEKEVISFPSFSASSVEALQFNPVLPYTLVTGYGDGKISISDVRVPSKEVYRWETTQRGVKFCQWFPHHPDLIASGGFDGTIRLWCLRVEPSYCVGTVQVGESAVGSMVITNTYRHPQIISTCFSGEISSCGPSDELLHAVAEDVLESRVIEDPNYKIKDLSLQQVERDALQHLYSHQCGIAAQEILRAATERLQWRDSSRALKLLSLLCPQEQEEFSPSFYLEEGPSSISSRLQQLVKEHAAHLPSEKTLELVMDKDQIPEAIEAQLQAIEVNASLSHALETQDIHLLPRYFSVIKELVGSGNIQSNAGLISRAIDFLLREAPWMGIRFVNELLASSLQGKSSAAEISPLVRMLTFQVIAPTVVDTNQISTHQSRQMQKKIRHAREGFLYDPAFAYAAIKLQLNLMLAALSSPNASHSIIKIVTQFESSQKENGLCRVLSLTPITLFLSALLDTNQYSLAFWVGAQWLTCFEGYPNISSVQILLEAEEARLIAALRHFTQLMHVQKENGVTVATLTETKALLQKFHACLLIMLQAMLELERYLTEGEGTWIESVVEDISNAILPALESWADILEVTTEKVKRQLSDPVMELMTSVQRLMKDVALQGENDETLSAVLNQCSNFLGM